MTRALPFLLLAACWSSTPAAPVPPAKAVVETEVQGVEPGECTTVDGTIRDMHTSEPLVDVEVSTGPEDDREITRTDADGRFVLRYRGHTELNVTSLDGKSAYMPIESDTCHLHDRYVELHAP